MASFFETVTEAIREFEENGFQSEERLAYWVDRIRAAAAESMTPEGVMSKTLKDSLHGIYTRMIEKGGIIRGGNSVVTRFTIDRVRPQLRAELDRRMMVSRNLIKLNRDAMIEKTVQRFAGWASSVPAGGSRAVDIKDVKDNVRKALAQLPFVERRVLIDQGAKLNASINEIVAVGGGAIAGRWASQWRRAGYDYREDHKERDGKFYLIRDNWAQENGLVKAGPAGYTDELTKPCEEISCSCSYTFVYHLRQLPESMLTEKGKKELEKLRGNKK